MSFSVDSERTPPATGSNEPLLPSEIKVYDWLMLPYAPQKISEQHTEWFWYVAQVVQVGAYGVYILPLGTGIFGSVNGKNVSRYAEPSLIDWNSLNKGYGADFIRKINQGDQKVVADARQQVLDDINALKEQLAVDQKRLAVANLLELDSRRLAI
jgi:hypothetical protein